MPEKYILGIDQSTQGTKALLFDSIGRLVGRCDRSHRQIINDKGWVEHDPLEIYNNVLLVSQDVVKKTGINKSSIVALGISNQRETALAWDKISGLPVYNAIVWQCARGEDICRKIANNGVADNVKKITGLPLSPYFSAAKLAWILENIEGARQAMERGRLGLGTMDSWLVYKLSGRDAYKTDYSNASRTQLFNITDLCWDKTVCGYFGIDERCLPEVSGSNALYGMTDFDGWLDTAIPIQAVLGDSHGALFGQGCHSSGMIKSTYGTGSSVMMNIGDKPIFSQRGLATSLAWSLDGKIQYVLEGNINYTGAVITWLKDQLQIIINAEETAELAENSNPTDKCYFVPAFSGLGAPYWDSEATAMFTGITRITGKNEFVRAALDCIAYQISDIVQLMQQEASVAIKELRVDGGPTKNRYLMQFQADIAENLVNVADVEELSGMGTAYAAGLAIGLYEKTKLFQNIQYKKYQPQMTKAERTRHYQGWQKAVRQTLQQV